MLQIQKIPTVGFASCCYLAYDSTERRGVLIDPSASLEEIENAVSRTDVALEKILLTHGHFDHIFSLDAVRDRYKIPAYIHESDSDFLTDAEKNASDPLLWEKQTYRPAERTLADGDMLFVGSMKIKVIGTAGHTAGSVCYRIDNVLFTGDTLFVDGFGRTDLYSGDAHTLRTSLQKLADMATDCTIYPGHGRSGKLWENAREALRWFEQQIF